MIAPADVETIARIYDAMLAAAAIANDLPLFTCKPSDFDAIDGLDLRSIPHPDTL